MMLRLILVTCMTSSVLSVPLHQLFKRNVIEATKRIDGASYDRLTTMVTEALMGHNINRQMTQSEVQQGLARIGANTDTAEFLASLFITDFDHDSNRLLNVDELLTAMERYSPYILP